MKGSFEVEINGESHRVKGLSVRGTLLEYLRRSGLTGCKEGCRLGGCGACTVVVEDRDPGGGALFRSVLSCLTLMPMVAGRRVITVEGLAREGRLHPVQEALAENLSARCGFCVPGLVMSLVEASQRQDLGTNRQLDDPLSGILCGCTGYGSLRAAAADAVSRPGVGLADQAFASPWRDRPAADADAEAEAEGLEYVDQSGCRFYRPRTVVELRRMRRQYPEAILIAGGTALAFRLGRNGNVVRSLISLEDIEELKTVIRQQDHWDIGASVTLTQLGSSLMGEYPAVDEMLRRIGSRQLRNCATIGGNLASASPVADLAPVLMALGAAARLMSPESEREVPVDQFYTGRGATCLREGEFLKSIRLPRAALGGAMRGAGDKLTRLCQAYKVSACGDAGPSIVSACFLVELNGKQEVQRARMAFAGAGPTPARALRAEESLRGQPWDEHSIGKAGSTLMNELAPEGDEDRSAKYCRALARGLLEKFFHEHAGVLAGGAAVRFGVGAQFQDLGKPLTAPGRGA